jgi:hypothetical protein
MIETNFFILTSEQYQENLQYASLEGVSLDYFLMEFCDIQGEDVYLN